MAVRADPRAARPAPPSPAVILRLPPASCTGARGTGRKGGKREGRKGGREKEKRRKKGGKEGRKGGKEKRKRKGEGE